MTMMMILTVVNRSRELLVGDGTIEFQFILVSLSLSRSQLDQTSPLKSHPTFVCHGLLISFHSSLVNGK